ncbi:GXWXG domain-containing protein [Nostoc sp. CHAB 5834]|nr:GXWXG domain-containing protein [Nostoc sp. CHAB 5834]
MEILENYQLILKAGKTTTEKALKLFDTLEPVNLGFMFGRWQGSGLHTNHPMDGLLEISNWYGKEFIDSENVHPLLFLNGQGKFFEVAPNPTLMNWVLKLPIPKNNSLKPLLISINSLLKTDKSQARLRMMEYRAIQFS